MKRVLGPKDTLSDLYDHKIALLEKLIANQKKQLQVLEFGKGEISAKIAGHNEKMIHQLVELDQKIAKIDENTPGNAMFIEKIQNVFSLADEARKNQEIIQKKMEELLLEIKKDLNSIQVKRQLFRHLHETRFWQSQHC